MKPQVSVFISCTTFSISAEMFHDYVLYMELVQSYFCTNRETEYSNMNRDTSAGGSLCHALVGHLCIRVRHCLFFVGQL